MLIYKNKFKRTEKGAITLGWKFELLNKKSGDLSGKLLLTEEQVIDVYAGSNLSGEKRNAMVNGKVIENSGIANYILMNENVNSAQDVIDNMMPIKEYVKKYPDIYLTLETGMSGNDGVTRTDALKTLNTEIMAGLVVTSRKPFLESGCSQNRIF